MEKKRATGKEEFERRATEMEEVGNHSAVSLGKADGYEKAARACVSAREIEKARENFLKAAHCYEATTTELVWGGINPYTKVGIEKYARKAFQSYRNARRLEKVREGTWHGLEGKTSATVAVIGLIGGLFFLSSNFTGNVIGSLTNSTSNIFGAVLLVVGLVGGFYWVKNRKSR